MTTKKENVLTIKSQAYNQAVAGDTITSVAQWCLASVVGFPVKADVPAEAKEQLYQGYRLRRNEVYKPSMSIVDSGRELLITVDVAYSYTSHEFGKLKTSEPKLHQAISEVRIATDKYCSKNYARLLAKGVELINESKGRSPRQTKTFIEQVQHAHDVLDGRAKLWGKDHKEDCERYTRALNAFNRIWNEKE